MAAKPSRSLLKTGEGSSGTRQDRPVAEKHGADAAVLGGMEAMARSAAHHRDDPVDSAGECRLLHQHRSKIGQRPQGHIVQLAGPQGLLQCRVRECHGDLHLANVLQLAGEATAFDCIEFDADLRWIDVLDDIAFLAMDLLANGRRDLAFRFINACLAAGGDYDGLPLLRHGMVCRALVRARVTALSQKQGTHSVARCGQHDYLALASALSCSVDARLAITHGLPGSGKSFAAQGVVEAAGAISVRSDVERKRLFGLGARQSSRGHVPGGIYDLAATQRTYSRLREIATAALAAGWPVVVDAAFLLRSEREAFSAVAASRCVPFTVLDCQAEQPLLRQRLAQRQVDGVDASEADAAVLDRLTAVDEPLAAAERAAAIVVDAAQRLPPATLARRWLAAPASVR